MQVKLLFLLIIIFVGLNSCIRSYCRAVQDFKKRKSCSVITKKAGLRGIVTNQD